MNGKLKMLKKCYSYMAPVLSTTDNKHFLKQ